MHVDVTVFVTSGSKVYLPVTSLLNVVSKLPKGNNVCKEAAHDEGGKRN